ERARPRHRRPPGERMHPLRQADRLPQDHPLDEQCADLGPTHLRGRRLPARPPRTPPELWPRARRRDVGAPIVTRYLAIGAAALTGIQVGSAMVATRFVVDPTGPISRALLRSVIGFCCLLPFVALSMPRVRFERRDVAPIALLGITQFGVLIALLNYGLRSVPSGRAALIFATFPLQTMLLAAALG